MKRAINFHPLAVGVMLACGASFTYAEPALEEVTVTAQKREQSLQEVPVAVTAIGEDALLQNGISDLTDIQKLSPNTTLQASRGTNSTLTAFIRGIGQQDPLWGFEPGVGIYVDDVYIARPQGAVLDILDVERVEVLRGPQGTLYGKNTIGGAVKYVTKKMSGDSRVSVSGALGSYNQRDLKVAGSAEIADGVYLGGAVASFQRDGFGENVLTGDEQYNKDIFSARVALEFNPSDTLWVRLAADQTSDKSAPKHGYRLAPGLGGEPVLDSVYDTESNMLYDNLVETSGASLTAEYQLNDSITLKSITAYRQGETETAIDFDSVNRPDFDVPAFYEDDQTTQEFQLIWEGDNADLVSGVYYYTGTAAGAFDAVLGYLANVPTVGFPLTQQVAGSVDTTSLSAYAHYNWSFAPDWNLSLGGRYTRDEKDASVFKGNFIGVYSPLFAGKYNPGQPAAVFAGALTDYENSDSWGEFTPHFGIDHQISEETMVYATYSAGFKSGGFDMRGDASQLPSTVDGFDPETVNTYEFGVKSDLFNNRLRLNAAAFRADYKDMQVTVQQFNAGGGFSSAVLNAGEARIQGIELEATLAMTDNLLANLALGYAETEFLEFISGGVDVADQRDMQNTPDTTAMFQLNYSMPMQSGAEIVFNPTISYRADTQIFETPSILDQDAYTLVDMTAMYYSADGTWQAGLVGKNLADEEYRIAGYAFGGAFDTGFYGAPRTIALTGSYSF
ncbi:iron complex outermembrane recepter protein [Microbulbifer donghaiensis]|uniref:Iron complex outermembrane recepter protein n=1 Tax=Microbulbifer donghaiensis TaxID=494016 RepID=A0A1M4ZUK6_9GAMM|nr:TonB-dependent receptor [Microbulbifer donghaiensis]SHF21733.1 iron complex outermembrane recepter protein [Microbulbifer donghaiensis]